jgi:dCMP deaminase
LDLPEDIKILLADAGIADVPAPAPRSRIGWDEYFMRIAELVSERSTCLSRQVGSVLVRDRRILATGYNGAPTGIEHCPFCIRNLLEVPSGERHEICRGLHAEQNCLIQCARNGVSSADSTIYIYGGTPCVICAKMLINAGVAHVVCSEEYPDRLGPAFLDEAGIDIRVIEIDWTEEGR